MAMGLDGGFDAEVTSLESTLDRATESYALALREQLAKRDGKGRDERFDQTSALALVSTSTFHVGQLRWKGVEVSDEFLRYAARVARGEQLMPYRGQVLAASSVSFPWNAALHGNVDGATCPTEPRVRRRKRSRSLLGWARGAGALVLCMLLLGVGAAAMTSGADEQRGWTLHSARPAHAAVLPAPAAPARAAEPEPGTKAPAAVASQPAEPELRARARAPRPALRRAAAAPVSAPAARSTSAPAASLTSTSATQVEAERAPETVAAAAPANAHVMTVVGSTVLPPLEELREDSGASSSLLLEKPSF